MRKARNRRINALLKKDAKRIGLEYSFSKNVTENLKVRDLIKGEKSRGNVYHLENPNKGVGNRIYEPYAQNFIENVPYLKNA